MEKIIHAIFGTEKDAFKAQQKMFELDANGDISLAEYYIISKDENGISDIKSTTGSTLEYTATGALVGGLFGVLGGPLGLLFGASAGALAGSTGDLIKDDQILSYLEEVKKNLPAGKTVIVAHVFENWEIPVDTSLKPFGAEIYRLDFEEQVNQAVQKTVEALDAKIAVAEKSLDDASEDLKAGINKDIAMLKEKRKVMATRITEKAAHQKKQYNSWIDKQKRKLEEWKEEVEEDVYEAKREKLEKEIARHEDKLASLKAQL